MSTMNTRYKIKINHLVQNWSKGVVGTQRWLDIQGISRFLAQQYCRSGWIERVAQGAYQLAGGSPKWTGAVYALQSQLKFAVHGGAQTALEIHSYRQYVAQSKSQLICLLKSPKEKRKLPQWFLENFEKRCNIYCVTRALFDDDQLELAAFAINDYELIVSTPERAILEYLRWRKTSIQIC